MEQSRAGRSLCFPGQGCTPLYCLCNSGLAPVTPVGLLQVCTKSAGFIAVVVDLPSPAWRLSSDFSFQFGL